MSEPSTTNIVHEFPKGVLVQWNDIGEPHRLPYLHSSTVIVSGTVIEGIGFAGSFDGKQFEELKDVDGDPILITKPGVYVLPFKVRYLKPVRGKGFNGTIQLFTEA